MATYTQVLPNNAGTLKKLSYDIDTITVGKVQPKYLIGTTTYTCEPHETITYVKATGNDAVDCKLECTDMAGNVVKIDGVVSGAGVEDADCLQGPWQAVKVVTADATAVIYINGGISK